MSSPSVQRWRESANENLEKLKSKIEEIPDVVEEVFTVNDRPKSAYQMPDLSNPDEVALHIAKLVSENHALKNERNLATNSSPQIKRSHSFQPSKIDERKGQRFLGADSGLSDGDMRSN